MNQLTLFEIDKKITSPVNVASVPFRSVFRYPGGKTWFVPYFRKWMKKYNSGHILVEPFAGGGIIGLTAAFEDLAAHIVLVEKDENLAAVWKTILSRESTWLIEKITNFEINPENVKKELEKKTSSLSEKAFQTILKNRVNRGGILAEGAGLIKNGENGRGLASRWYAKTLAKRISEIQSIKNKINFIEGDGFNIIREKHSNPKICFFIDPPYTIAGKRLYKYYKIDHEKLISLCSKLTGNFIITYDESTEIEALAKKYGLKVGRVLMKTTHHIKKYELVISKDIDWLES